MTINNTDEISLFIYILIMIENSIKIENTTKYNSLRLDLLRGHQNTIRVVLGKIFKISAFFFEIARKRLNFLEIEQSNTLLMKIVKNRLFLYLNLAWINGGRLIWTVVKKKDKIHTRYF